MFFYDDKFFSDVYAFQRMYQHLILTTSLFSLLVFLLLCSSQRLCHISHAGGAVISNGRKKRGVRTYSDSISLSNHCPFYFRNAAPRLTSERQPLLGEGTPGRWSRDRPGRPFDWSKRRAGSRAGPARRTSG